MSVFTPRGWAQRLTSSVFLHRLPSLLRQSLSPNLELAGLAKQVPQSSQGPSCVCFLSPGIYMRPLCGWGPSTGLHSCVVAAFSQTSCSSVSRQRMHAMGILCSTVHLWPSLISQSLLSFVEISLLICRSKSLIVEWTTQHLLLGNGVSSIIGIILVGDIKDFLYQIHFLLVCFR